MNTPNSSAPWVPYKIPPTPAVGEYNNLYGLSFVKGASPIKNPSQFLEWRALLPVGKDNDLLKWQTDRWVVFSPSGSQEEPFYLNYNGSDLSWGPVNFPKGSSKGDIIYWNPESGDEGEWVILPPSGSEEEPLYLACRGEEPSWEQNDLPEGSTKGDLLYWDPEAGNGGSWVVLTAPSANGSILYWDDGDWNFLTPPSGSGLKVLTASGGNLAWTDTEDCD